MRMTEMIYANCWFPVASILTFSCLTCVGESAKEGHQNDSQVWYATSFTDEVLDLHKTIGNKLTLVSEYKVGESEFFPSLHPEFPFEYPTDMLINDDKLYILNSRDNILVMINLLTRTTITSGGINSLIQNYATIYGHAERIAVHTEMICVGFAGGGIVCFDAEGKFDFAWKTDNMILEFMTILLDGSLLLFQGRGTVHLSNAGVPLQTFDFTLTSGKRFSSGDKVLLAHEDVIRIIGLEESGETIRQTVQALDWTDIDIEHPFPSDFSSSYSLWFPRVTRDKLVLLSRRDNRHVKTIDLATDRFAYNAIDGIHEEGSPRFRFIAQDDSNYYLVVMLERIIQVYHIAFEH